MPVESIRMTSFRNHTKTELTFGPGINVIWGENGSGKTSVLEAIYILSTGKSFKTKRLPEIIKEDFETTRVSGIFSRKDQKKEIAIGQTKTGRRKITINSAPAQIRELLLESQTVLLSPEEEEITKGAPSVRRQFFDRLFSTISKEYLTTLIDYTKTLKQRNALLKTKNPEKQIELWDATLAQKAEKLWALREFFLNNFSTCLKTTSKDYSCGEILIRLIREKTKLEKKEFISALIESRKKDLITQTTNCGPHRDVYSFSINEKKIKTFGSQGEHKIALVIIKLSEYLLVKEETAQTPTLLLDDLFARLDFERSDAVLALLKKKTQTIITNTDLVDIKKHGINLDDPKNKNFHLRRPCKN